MGWVKDLRIFLLTTPITDWHTIGRSTIYGCRYKPIVIKRKKRHTERARVKCAISSSLTASIFGDSKRDDANLSNRAQNGSSFYASNEDGFRLRWRIFRLLSPEFLFACKFFDEFYCRFWHRTYFSHLLPKLRVRAVPKSERERERM